MPDPTTLTVPAKLHRVARVETLPPIGGTRAAEGVTEYRVRIALSSDEPYRRAFGDEVLGHTAGEIDTTRLEAGAPALTDHENTTAAIVGRLENHAIDPDGRLRVDVVFDPEYEPAQQLYSRIARGFVKDVSVGYSVQQWQITGRRDGVDEYRAIRWTPMEASFVAVPADASVGAFREASGTALVSVPVVRAPHPADEARSPNVSDTLPASHEAIPPAPMPAPQQSREAELAEIAQLTGRAGDLLGWITSGKSVAAVRAEILAAQRTANGDVVQNPVVEVGAMREAERPFDDAPDFFRAVITAGKTNGRSVDPRLYARAQNTVLGEEGGFAVPPAITAMMLEATRTGGELLSRVTTRPVGAGNTYTETVVAESARTAGNRNGGVRAYWLAEDGTYTESQAKMRQIDLKLQKLGALVRVTDEQMEDGPALVSFLNEQVPEELRFETEKAIWDGTGTGMPLGAMASGALVTVAIESGQTIANTNTHLWMNAAKMFSRLPARSLGNAVWFINQQLWAKILTAVAGTAGAHPMFTPPGQLASAPFGALYGRPIIPIEYASAEGTVGDFVLADMSDYLFIDKGAIRSQSSMHVDFIRDRQLLKFTWRVNGAPRSVAPITPLNGGAGASLSPYVALAARS